MSLKAIINFREIRKEKKKRSMIDTSIPGGFTKYFKSQARERRLRGY